MRACSQIRVFALSGDFGLALEFREYLADAIVAETPVVFDDDFASPRPA